MYKTDGVLIRGPFGRSSFSKLSGGPRPVTVGKELDFTAKYIFNRHANVQVGYSHFFVGDVVEYLSPDKDIDFFYSQFGFIF